MRTRRRQAIRRWFHALAHERRQETSGLLLLAFALFLAFCLFLPRRGGPVGGTLARAAATALGHAGAFILPMVLFVIGYLFVRGKNLTRPGLRGAGVFLGLGGGCAFLHLVGSVLGLANMGGWLGRTLVTVMTHSIGGGGTVIVSGVAVLFSAMLIGDWSFADLLGAGEAVYQRLEQRLRTLEEAPSPARGGRKVTPPPLHPAPPAPIPIVQAPVARRAEPARTAQPVAKPIFRAGSRTPPMEILDLPQGPSAAPENHERLKANKALLEKTLADFGVTAHVYKINPGPIITRYDLQPTPGTKVQRIVTLQNDIALAMKAQAIRILAPIPGEAAVGIEIPNETRSTVTLREIFASPQFTASRAPLTVAMGKTTSGDPYVINLADQPHLLVGGATGAGKSVFLHNLITSLIFKSGPENLRFILIDLKRLELTAYSDLPHMEVPVITEPREASQALRGLVNLMETRYNQFSKARVRNIREYNEAIGEDGAPSRTPVPYIVTIIDELGDLMMVAKRDVEDAIIRLSSKARGVGIHLVLATQRPSVDIITGVIKANLPSRVAFQVLSQTDSRVILDQKGAEDLLGRGDMLFLSSGNPFSARLQAAYVSRQEVERVVQWWRQQWRPPAPRGDGGVSPPPGGGPPTTTGRALPDWMVEAGRDEEQGNAEHGRPELLRAVRLVRDRRKISYDLLKANGFSGPKAANLISLMEVRGLIHKPEGGNRWVIHLDRLEEAVRALERPE